ncbi:GEVED domain-containing protein [uncultured Marixanthomonas sp.]|uniref:GEVED domain-containing protein n=1 Tax=uncultured Marixanthomonas sp. TaxID=757245 RepID=UPI0030DD1193|tara:strand:- start:107897 stop:110521 length:2625 start_codon:yes stop_codon:yes gene_type:complete
MKKKYKIPLLFFGILISISVHSQQPNTLDARIYTPYPQTAGTPSSTINFEDTHIGINKKSTGSHQSITHTKQTNTVYCEPAFSSCSDYIEKVIFSGINNDSECEIGLRDYTDQVGLVKTGDTYTISVRTHALSSQYVFAYIDWNQNGVLDDAGEIYTIAASVHHNGPHTKEIEIPQDAILGETRMRVIMQWNNPNPDPCIVYSSGEAEDYTLQVVDEIPILPEDCSQLVPASQNGNGHFFMGETNQKLAVDIDILAESSFEVQSLKIQTLGQATTFDLVFYANENGVPGSSLITLTDVAIIEEDFIGQGSMYDHYVYTLDLSSENVLFEGELSGKKFWMEVLSDATGWNNTTFSTLGNFGYFFNDNSNQWRPTEVEYVYELIGTCLGDQIQDLPNNACSSALPIVCGDNVLGTTVGADDFGGNSSPDVFYSYTGTGQPENISLSLCNGTAYDTQIRVFSDCSLSNEIASNNNFCYARSVVDFISDGTSTYYIMIEGGGSNDLGDFTLYSSCSEITFENEEPSQALPLVCGDRVLGNTVTVSNTAGNPSGDVFYSYTGNGVEEDITVSLCSIFTGYDTEIRVYDSIELTNEVAFVDDSCGLFSQLTFYSDGVKTYYIMIEGSDSDEGNFGLSLSCWDYTPYCSPLNFVYVEPITNVEIAGISHRSNVATTSPPHEVFTDIIGTMNQGDTYDITLEGFTGSDGAWENFFTVFIDWNQNDVFTDSGEMFEIGSIFNSTGTDGKQLLGTITVPIDALLGSTVMRVLKGYNESPTDPCANYGYGQVEDYSINVMAELSTVDYKNHTISYYPNPVKDILNIESDMQFSKVTIYDISGKVVYNAMQKTNKIQKDLSFLSSGIYLAKVISDQEVHTIKITKE